MPKVTKARLSVRQKSVLSRIAKSVADAQSDERCGPVTVAMSPQEKLTARTLVVRGMAKCVHSAFEKGPCQAGLQQRWMITRAGASALRIPEKLVTNAEIRADIVRYLEHDGWSLSEGIYSILRLGFQFRLDLRRRDTVSVQKAGVRGGWTTVSSATYESLRRGWKENNYNPWVMAPGLIAQAWSPEQCSIEAAFHAVEADNQRSSFHQAAAVSNLLVRSINGTADVASDPDEWKKSVRSRHPQISAYLTSVGGPEIWKLAHTVAAQTAAGCPPPRH